MLPYGKQCVDEEDIAAVVEVLRSDYLTTGPAVDLFEEAFAAVAGTRHAVAVANGTAALHAIMAALEIGPGDEVIVPAMTFAASANCVLYQGGTPVFVDVEPDTLLLDAAAAEAAITPRTKAIVAVDYAGQPCDYDALHALATRHNLALIADACHALGATYKGRPVGSLALMSAFSLHPVKPITSGEGGVITTDDAGLARRLRIFRNHGITTDHRQREQRGAHYYEMCTLGYNYRLSDIHAALGRAQLTKLADFTSRRQAIAAHYNKAFAKHPIVQPLTMRPDRTCSYHLYMVQLQTEHLQTNRNTIFNALRQQGIGANVHYIPVHLHPYYRNHQNTRPGQCPIAEAAYQRLLTLPLFPTMSDINADNVTHTLKKLTGSYR